MTSLVVLNLIEKFEHATLHASLQASIKISRPVSQMNGTSANLREGDILTVHELMYGMMLPSGNDAAQALAIHFGGIVKNNGGNKSPEVVVT